MKQSFFITTLLTTSVAAAEYPRYYSGTRTPYYTNHAYTTTQKVPFYRPRRVSIFEKFTHAHSGESASEEVDSLHSEHSSLYSDECPDAYDCSDKYVCRSKLIAHLLEDHRAQLPDWGIAPQLLSKHAE